MPPTDQLILILLLYLDTSYFLFNTGARGAQDVGEPSCGDEPQARYPRLQQLYICSGGRIKPSSEASGACRSGRRDGGGCGGCYCGGGGGRREPVSRWPRKEDQGLEEEAGED